MSWLEPVFIALKSSNQSANMGDHAKTFGGMAGKFVVFGQSARSIKP